MEKYVVSLTIVHWLGWNYYFLKRYVSQKWDYRFETEGDLDYELLFLTILISFVACQEYGDSIENDGFDIDYGVRMVD